MNPTKQRIAIAESVGWKHREGGMWYCLDGSTVPETLIPDYPNDLNAMHEVEKRLKFSRRSQFQLELQLVLSKGLTSNILISFRECIHATASQRAEAYLRTIGKWVDDNTDHTAAVILGEPCKPSCPTQTSPNPPNA